MYAISLHDTLGARPYPSDRLAVRFDTLQHAIGVATVLQQQHDTRGNPRAATFSVDDAETGVVLFTTDSSLVPA